MDQELTGKAFKRFMRRRGLSRDESHEPRHFGPEYVDEHLPPPPPLPPRNQSLPHRTTMLHGSGSGTRSVLGPSAASGSIRRTQSTFETGQGQTPRRRRRDDAEEPTKKQYRCEYCNLTFGRKHHKERHVANIHRQVRPGLHSTNWKWLVANKDIRTHTFHTERRNRTSVIYADIHFTRSLIWIGTERQFTRRSLPSDVMTAV